MYRQILESIAGMEVWPIVALIIFFATFGAIIVWTIRMKKSEVDHLSNLPLEPDDEHQLNGDRNHG